MDSRKLLFDEYIALLEQMPGAEKTDIGGGMDIYHGQHPQLGEVILVCTMGEHAVLISHAPGTVLHWPSESRTLTLVGQFYPH